MLDHHHPALFHELPLLSHTLSMCPLTFMVLALSPWLKNWIDGKPDKFQIVENIRANGRFLEKCGMMGMEVKELILFFFFFFLPYNTVLVLPYIDMNPPRVYMRSQT